MNLNNHRIIAVLVTQLFILTTTSAQLVYEMKFAGKLANIQGKAISSEEFDLSVQLTREGKSPVLFEINTSASTDEEGWFEYSIEDVYPILSEEGELKHTVVIKMEVTPNAKTEWIGEGEGFMVIYTLIPDQDSTESQLMITRLEGSTLVKHNEKHLMAFKDQDPFGYLLGGFLITDQPPIKPESTGDLKQWLAPENQDAEGGASRGVKGGFPSGGYHKKK
jgi:hypothetical protein